jgi:mannose-6-phosphate isomerase-like protein (cupin superfamily)
MRSHFRLPFTFDRSRLRADLDAVPADLWTPHFQPTYFEGDWSGVALRSVGGSVNRLFPHRNPGGQYVDTPLLERCPYIRQVIATFECDKEAVRLLRLAPGARILEHCDEKLNRERGVVRVHVPITTHPDVDFVLDGERVVMREGESWYLDLARPHRVENRGTTDRVHLVIDCCLCPWTDALLLDAGGADGIAS